VPSPARLAKPRRKRPAGSGSCGGRFWARIGERAPRPPAGRAGRQGSLKNSRASRRATEVGSCHFARFAFFAAAFQAVDPRMSPPTTVFSGNGRRILQEEMAVARADLGDRPAAAAAEPPSPARMVARRSVIGEETRVGRATRPIGAKPARAGAIPTSGFCNARAG